MVVSVTKVAEHHGAVIDVSGIDELVKIAKRYALLDWTDGVVDVYFVEDENTMYRCIADHYDGHAHRQSTPNWPGAADTDAPKPTAPGTTPGRGGARHAGSARTGGAGGGHGAARHTST